MKKKILICCEMIRKEMTLLLEETAFDGEILWMEKGLHENPDRLREALQKEIDSRDGLYEEILLGYGLCGNGITGLKACRSKLIVPKFDDCIRMLLSHEQKAPILSNPRTLYYTDGWMDVGQFLLSDQNSYFERYGEKRAMRVIKAMLANYRSVTFLETGNYDIEECSACILPMTEKLGLGINRTSCSVRIFRKLLTGPYDEEFVVAQPGEEITVMHFEGRARCVAPEENMTYEAGR